MGRAVANSGNRWQMVGPRKRQKQAKTVAVGSFAREAVRFVPTEMPNPRRTDLLLELAEILRAAGDATGATRAIGEAIDLYKRKGNLPAAARARSAWPLEQTTRRPSADSRPGST